MTGKPVAENLFRTGPDGIRLVAGRRKRDARVMFPFPGGNTEDIEEILLGNEGTLWSFTVQRFRPKSPFNGDGDDADFAPYAVGYVELAGEAIIEARLVAADVSQLYIGMPMRLVSETYRTDEHGQAVVTFAFAPAHDGARK